MFFSWLFFSGHPRLPSLGTQLGIWWNSQLNPWFRSRCSCGINYSHIFWRPTCCYVMWWMNPSQGATLRERESGIWPGRYRDRLWRSKRLEGPGPTKHLPRIPRRTSRGCRGCLGFWHEATRNDASMFEQQRLWEFLAFLNFWFRPAKTMEDWGSSLDGCSIYWYPSSWMIRILQLLCCRKSKGRRCAVL